VHFLNLLITKVCDDKVNGLYLHWFIEHANLFAHPFRRRHAALVAASEAGACAISAFAVHCFTSLAIKHWSAVASSYLLLHNTFRVDNPNCWTTRSFNTNN
jgi:hypothetical protein